MFNPTSTCLTYASQHSQNNALFGLEKVAPTSQDLKSLKKSSVNSLFTTSLPIIPTLEDSSR